MRSAKSAVMAGDQALGLDLEHDDRCLDLSHTGIRVEVLVHLGPALPQPSSLLLDVFARTHRALVAV